MKSFREWLQSEAEASGDWTASQQTGQFPKPWKAQKAQVVEHWKNLRPGLPFGQVRAIPVTTKVQLMGLTACELREALSLLIP